MYTCVYTYVYRLKSIIASTHEFTCSLLLPLFLVFGRNIKLPHLPLSHGQNYEQKPKEQRRSNKGHCFHITALTETGKRYVSLDKHNTERSIRTKLFKIIKRSETEFNLYIPGTNIFAASFKEPISVMSLASKNVILS